MRATPVAASLRGVAAAAACVKAAESLADADAALARVSDNAAPGGSPGPFPRYVESAQAGGSRLAHGA